MVFWRVNVEIYNFRTKSAGRGTYRYEFEYDQSFLEYPEEWITGSHIDDLYSVLGERFSEAMRERFMEGDGEFNDTEQLIARRLTTAGI